MTVGTRDNRTTLIGEHNVLGFLVALVFAPGCPLLPPPPPPVQPDLKAIVTVVEDAYGQLRRATSVFLAADGVEGTTMARVRSTLGSDLASTFLPPSARISGDPGASIALGRFNLGEDGRLSVVASFVQEDGAGRGCTRYTLDREGDDWVVANTLDAWPDCPISSQGEESYHDALERARSVECFWFGTGIGNCGPWLYVIESTGFTGTESFYDPQTGLMVARKLFTDAGPVFDWFVFGQVECEPTVTDRIPCERAATPWIDCGDSFLSRGCDTSIVHVCGNDNRTYRNAGEACCFVDRYQEGPCEAGTSSRADECRDGGGFWDCGGLRQCWFCNRQTADAGEPCTDGRECEGSCLAEGFPPSSQTCQGAQLGNCSATTVIFGCFCELHEGKGYGICVD